MNTEISLRLSERQTALVDVEDENYWRLQERTDAYIESRVSEHNEQLFTSNLQRCDSHTPHIC